METETKGALPYKETPMADKGMAWDGPKQMSMCAGEADYRAICAWVDSSGDPAVQASYKLPHHMAMGDHSVVWNGVKAAMGALMGARGGVNIPDSDKQAVYNHLAKHYKQFDETAPTMAAAENIVTREVGEKVYVPAFTEETKDLGAGVIEATVNTGQPDRQGEQIVVSGVDLTNYKQNSVVLYGHDYYSLPIGKAVSTYKTNGKIVAKFQLAVEEYPFAATVYNLIKGGYLNAVSIGVIVKEWSTDFTQILQSEMVEFSVVPVPADKGALITRSLAEIGKTEEQFKTEYKDFVVKSLAEKSSKDELETHIKNLESLVALLRETHKESRNEAAPTQVKKIHRIVLGKTAGQIVKESEKAVHLIKVSLKESEVK